MFAVPGWKLGELKSQAEAQEPSKGSKKRKRKQEEKEKENGPPHGEDLDALYKRHVEGIVTPRKPRTKPKKRRTAEDDGGAASGAAKAIADAEDARKAGSEGTRTEASEKLRPFKKESKAKDRTDKQSKNRSSSAMATNPSDKLAQIKPPPLPAQTKLTPMQSAMRQKLISARFRHLNQSLYTSPSNQAGRLFDDNPTFFEEYHSGFRQQVSTWPENPVDGFIEDVKTRASTRALGKDDASQKSQTLPKTSGTCTIADLGCGDAKLAQQLLKDSKQMSLKLLSFDLHSPSAMVRKADIANLPLADGSVNVAILCLALMGTNWTDFVDEAWRVLRWKGELWVAEIKSRFVPPKRARVEHSVGNRKKAVKKPSQIDEGQEETLRILVDGAEDGRPKTDVTAFVEVLKGRGFSLYGEDAVDMSNKMFVKLRFVKALSPTRGKHAGKGHAGGKRVQLGRRDTAPVVVTEDDGLEETSVLKPCLYKIR